MATAGWQQGAAHNKRGRHWRGTSTPSAGRWRRAAQAVLLTGAFHQIQHSWARTWVIWVTLGVAGAWETHGVPPALSPLHPWHRCQPKPQPQPQPWPLIRTKVFNPVILLICLKWEVGAVLCKTTPFSTHEVTACIFGSAECSMTNVWLTSGLYHQQHLSQPENSTCPQVRSYFDATCVKEETCVSLDSWCKQAWGNMT